MMLLMSTPSAPENPKLVLARRALFYLAVSVLTVLSLLPTDRLPEFTASIWDKAQHAAGFAVLGTLGLWAYPGGVGHSARVVLGLLALGVAIELAQGASGWRHADAGDALADAVGVAVGWALSRALK